MKRKEAGDKFSQQKRLQFETLGQVQRERKEPLYALYRSGELDRKSFQQEIADFNSAKQEGMRMLRLFFRESEETFRANLAIYFRNESQNFPRDGGQD